MNLGGLTREQRLLGAAGACVVYIISLFLDWFGGPLGGSASRQDLDGWWILLIIAIVAGGIFAADALNFELPPVFGITLATYLMSLLAFDSIIKLFELTSRKYGFFLALIAALVGTGLAISVWREDR
jgi:hypothetical protein